MRAWRKIESAIVTSERLSLLSDGAKWLFVLLLVAQDDKGRYPWTPTMVRSLTVTTSWSASDCDSLLSELRVANVAEVRDGFVILRNGAEKNGTPANSKKYIMLYPAPEPLAESNDESLTSRQRVASESLTIVQSRVEERREEKRSAADAAHPLLKKTWEPPEFFKMIATLEGYRKADHSRAAAVIEAACRDAGLDPKLVVDHFVSQYNVLKLTYGWHDPVAAFKGRPLAIAISQVKGDNNGRRPIAQDLHQKRMEVEHGADQGRQVQSL